jgi:hypothetical protein
VDETTLPPGTYCKGCGQPLDEATDLPVEERQPCGKCGSLSRHKAVSISGTVESKAMMYMRAKSPPGTKRGLSHRRAFVESWSGDSFHRDSGQWNRLQRLVDRANDRYFEQIEGPDGTVLVHQDEPLSEHQDHGAAKARSARRTQGPC